MQESRQPMASVRSEGCATAYRSQQAQDDMTRVAAQLEQQYPDTNRQRGVQVLSMKDALLGSTARCSVSCLRQCCCFCSCRAPTWPACSWHERRRAAASLPCVRRSAHGGGTCCGNCSSSRSCSRWRRDSWARSWRHGEPPPSLAVVPDGALPPHVVRVGRSARLSSYASIITCAVAVLVAIVPVAAAREARSGAGDPYGWPRVNRRSRQPASPVDAASPDRRRDSARHDAVDSRRADGAKPATADWRCGSDSTPMA